MEDDVDSISTVFIPGRTAWHASPISKESLSPMDHVGTRRAALERGLSYGKPFVLHEVDLAGGTALRIPDSMGSTHRLGGMIEVLESRLDMPFALADSMLTRSRTKDPHVARDLAVHAMLRGVDLLVYDNAVEDPGSTSFVVLDPPRSPMVSRTAMDPHLARTLLEDDVVRDEDGPVEPSRAASP